MHLAIKMSALIYSSRSSSSSSLVDIQVCSREHNVSKYCM